MPPPLRIAASLVSLFCCAAAVALWLRGYAGEDACHARVGLRYLTLASFRGEVGCEFGEVCGGGPPDLYTPHTVFRLWRWPAALVRGKDEFHIAEYDPHLHVVPHYHDYWGFRWHPRTDRDWTHRARGIAVPAWAVVALFAVLPIRSGLRMTQRSARRRANRCAACGYDLRATPDRCPECGKTQDRDIFNN
jgi:hypothetical protein